MPNPPASNLLLFPTPAPTPPLTTTPSDTTARELALDTRRSCIVEAPAGSGKTGLLVQRFLKLLAHEDLAQPEEILAITFTNKATAELKARVLADLNAAHLNTPVPAEPFDQLTRSLAQAALTRSTRLGWNLLTQPHRFNIRSIDSVCALLANSAPLLSGSGGDRQPVLNASSLYRSAARRTFLQLGGPDPTLNAALRTLLQHRDGNLADCESLLASMLDARDQWAQLIPLDPASLDDAVLDRDIRPRLERSLEQIVCSGLSRALAAVPSDLLHDLAAFAARLGVEPGYKGAPSPIALCATLHQPPEATAGHLDHWAALIGLLFTQDEKWRASFNVNHIGVTLSRADKSTLQQLIAEFQSHPGSELIHEALCAVLALPPARYPDDQWHVAKALFRILRRALAELQLLFADRSECDFTEISLAARQALRATDTLDLIPGVTLRHLLVDELQDTSSGQYDLLELLTRSWDGVSQTLFLVGDPKQSIYLFREARVERFLRIMHDCRLGEIPLTPLRLTTNFRSQANLVSGFNDAFIRLFPPPNDPSLRGGDAVDVPFVEANADRDPTPLTGIVWHTSVLGEETLSPTLDYTDNPELDHRAQEALTIRRLIELRLDLPLPDARANPPKPWRIAVLGRNRSHFTALVAEFKIDRGRGPLPFRAVELDPLNDLPEVLDALALTRALLHPADRVAWLAVLHSPFCGLGLADLLTLTNEGPSADTHATIAHLVATRQSLLSPEAQQLLARAWPVLSTAAATLGRTPLSIHVERTWRSLGGDAHLPPARQANVLRFLTVLRELEAASGLVDLSALTTRLEQLFAEPAAGPIAVDLMTIHKAKGLEWDLVLVPALERGSGEDRPPLLNWLELDNLGPETHPDQAEASIVLAPIDARGGPASKLPKWLSALRRRRDRAERKRLFYVASTRAREELHLFAAAKRKIDGTLTTPLGDSLLKACWPAAEPHFAPHAAAAAPLTYDLTDTYELALAASADPPAPPPLLQRLPLSFDPSARFALAAQNRLAYPVTSPLPSTAAFTRPDGSFAVRAFGNVVHRYLQLLSQRLTATTPPTLLAELPTWLPRLTASLRAEGLAPTLATREATRALRALTLSLSDPTGLWLLSPHPLAASEQSLTLPGARGLRIDRTFLAGPTPLTPGDTTIWIIDFKTTEQGSRSDPAFAASELAKYTPQLEAYAALRRQLPGGHLPLRLGLFYPLIPRLLECPSPTLPFLNS